MRGLKNVANSLVNRGGERQIILPSPLPPLATQLARQWMDVYYAVGALIASQESLIQRRAAAVGAVNGARTVDGRLTASRERGAQRERYCSARRNINSCVSRKLTRLKS